MDDCFASARNAIEDSVLRGPGRVDPALRQAIADHLDLPEALRRLVEKIRSHAYKVTDEDVAALKSTYSDDQLFEIILCAALGAAQDRLRAGLAALKDS